ncbi:hypothetical protein P3S68_008153 [Capsicum galapagoense]
MVFATVQRDLEKLSEQSQSGKSEDEKRCENNVEGGKQRSVDGDEENESEKKKELESQKEKEDDHQHDDNGSPTGRELISISQHDPVKTFSINRSEVAMPINNPEEKQLTGQIVLKCQMGEFFEHFMKIMKNQNIGGLFKKSCFGCFLELPEESSAHIRFPMTMVYGLLKRRIKYTRDDKDPEIDKIWINYCGMSVCFGLQEFAMARKSSDLLTDLEDKTIPEQYKEQLCLVWFAHSVILARDINKVLEDDLLARAKDFDKFNNYPWGYDSFYLTVQYLLTKLSSRTTTLYGFPWAFMAWAFEAIPPLRKQLMDYPDEVSHPRMFRWLVAKSNTNIKEADLFNPSDDAVVNSWIVSTEEESVMTSYITLGHVDTIADPTVELIKKELAGATAIRRAVRQGQPNVEALHDQPFTKTDPGASSGGVDGVGGRYADAATTHDDENVDAQERINMFENTSFRPYIGQIG